MYAILCSGTSASSSIPLGTQNRRIVLLISVVLLTAVRSFDHAGLDCIYLTHLVPNDPRRFFFPCADSAQGTCPGTLYVAKNSLIPRASAILDRNLDQFFNGPLQLSVKLQMSSDMP